MVGRDRQIAQDMEHVPTADRIAVDGGDYGLRQVTDQPVQRLDLEDAVLRIAVVPCFGPLLLIAARTKCAIARSGEGDHPYACVAPGRLQRRDQLVHGSPA